MAQIRAHRVNRATRCAAEPFFRHNRCRKIGYVARGARPSSEWAIVNVQTSVSENRDLGFGGRGGKVCTVMRFSPGIGYAREWRTGMARGNGAREWRVGTAHGNGAWGACISRVLACRRASSEHPRIVNIKEEGHRVGGLLGGRGGVRLTCGSRGTSWPGSRAGRRPCSLPERSRGRALRRCRPYSGRTRSARSRRARG